MQYMSTQDNSHFDLKQVPVHIYVCSDEVEEERLEMLLG